MNDDRRIFLPKMEKAISSPLRRHLSFVLSLTLRQVLDAHCGRHLVGPVLFTPKWIARSHRGAKPGAPRKHLSTLPTVAAQHNPRWFPLPLCPGPSSQIIQHTPAPCQFGSTNVYFQRNLSWPLLVHFPHNSSQAVCVMLRESILRPVPPEPGSPQCQR